MLLLRVDDFPGTKPEEFWRHNLDNFKRFHDVVSKYVPEYLLGVIPRHSTEEQLKWLGQQFNSIRVAMHGVNHDERFQNEFGDHLTENDIYHSICSAKIPLNDLAGPIFTYIPPHNVFDQKTCRSLKKAGIKNITGGPESPDVIGTEVVSSTAFGLKYMKSLAPLGYGRSDELLQRGSIDWLIEREKNDLTTYLCLHWTWEWNIGLDSLKEYLKQLSGVFKKFEGEV
jgi:hypothetical protein